MLSLFVAVVLVFPSASLVDADKALARADEHFAADEPGLAEPLYQIAIDSGNRFVARQAHERLIALYIKSGRPDKAVKQCEVFRLWLNRVGDKESLAMLEVLLGECYLALGHYATADARYARALSADPPLSVNDRLRALQGRAEVAVANRDPSALQRWKDLNTAATQAAASAERVGNRPDRIIASRALAESLFRQGDEVGALGALATLLSLQDSKGNPLGRRDTLRQRAEILSNQGHYPEAAPLFREALDLHRTYRKTKPMLAGDILADWSIAAAAAGQKADANSLRAQALVEYTRVLKNPAAGDVLHGGPLAAFAKMQQLTRSARQFRQALDLSREAAGRWPDDPLLDARLKADRGGLELMIAAYQTARDLLRRSLADIEQSQPVDLRTLPAVLVNLAAAELGCDTPDLADKLLNRCASLYSEQGLPADVVLAECEYLRGAAAAQRGDFRKAINFFRSGIKVANLVGPLAEPVRYNLLLNTALIHKEQGDYEEAAAELALADKSLATFAEPDDVAFAIIRAVRADIALSQGKTKNAAELSQGILELCRKNGVRGGYLWGTAWHALALEAIDIRNDLPAAEKIWTGLIEGNLDGGIPGKGQRAERHLLLARSLNYLGILAERQKRFSEADRYYSEAARFTENNPRVPVTTQAVTLWRLASSSDRAGNKAQAKNLLSRVFEIADEARLKTFGAAAQRAAFYAQFSPMFEQLARWAARDNQAEELMRIITRTRSRTFLDTTLSAGIDPREGLTGPDAKRLIDREAEARLNVSRTRSRVQLLSSDEASTPNGQKLIAEFEEAQKEYADAWKEIVNADPVTRSLTANSNQLDQTIQKLQRRLGPKTGILAYLIADRESYAVFLTTAIDPSNQATTLAQVYPLTISKVLSETITDAPRVVAMGGEGLATRGVVVRSLDPQPEAPAADPNLVPLRSQVATRLIDRYLRHITDASFQPARGVVIRSLGDQQPPVATRSETLGESLLPSALRAKIREAGIESLVIIPDGPLHKIPMECLTVPTPAGPRYALDDLPAIAYSPSAAVLSVIAERPRKTDGPANLLTVGDPAYPEPVAPAPKANSVAKADEPTLKRNVTPTQQSTILFRDSLPRLPGTALESARIQTFFPRDRVTSLMGVQATERQVTEAVGGKRYIHLAAHGFAHEDFGNLFAAIALSPSASKEITDDDDGLLTLHEISRLKLTGCELTVLSACVTNVGPQRPLEAGVTLAGAFLTAGSRGVIASCWSVDDAATAELMSTFFRDARTQDPKPASYANALRQARLKVRSTPGFEAPFYWAPFVYVGLPE